MTKIWTSSVTTPCAVWHTCGVTKSSWLPRRLKWPSPQVLLALRALGGAMGRVPEDATAYGNRQALFNLSIDSSWADPADTERHIDWTRRNWSALRELTDGGVYLNFAGLGEDGDTLARAAHGTNYDRLRQVKRLYDPENLFRGNINIAP